MRFCRDSRPSRLDTYFTKPGYRENGKPEVYRDSLEDALTYQLAVYKHASEIAREPQVVSALDLGCGLGIKLVKYLAPYCDITGVDQPPTIERCRECHSVGRWIAGNLEDPGFTVGRVYDLIIAADVIEHLRYPDRLLKAIRDASHEETRVVISTPERDRRRGEDHMGPPDNLSHVREWNSAEFSAYLHSRDFVIQKSLIVDLCVGMRTCQMVVGGFPKIQKGSH